MIGLVVLVTIVVLVVLVISQRRGREPSAEGGAGIRRFFVYAALLAALNIAAVGIAGLIAQALPQPADVERDAVETARFLALAVVAVPMYAGLLRWVWPRLTRDPEERSSLGWTLYLTAAQLWALLTAGGATFGVLLWLFGNEPWSPREFGTALVWAVVLVTHIWLERRMSYPERVRPLHVAGSVVGLGALGVAIWFGASTALAWVYESWTGAVVMENVGENLRSTAAGGLVAAPVWWWYWIRTAGGETILALWRTGLWKAYVMLAGLLTGVLVALVSGGIIVYTALEWWFGDPATTSAAVQFEPVSFAVAGVAIGVGSWLYHRRFLPAESIRTEPDRVYDYLLSGVGLAAAVGGVTTLLVAALEALAPETVSGTGESAINTLMAALTFLILGAPVWWVFWRRAQRHAADDAGELVSPSRRTYLSLFFGVAGAASAISLLIAVVTSFEAIAENRFGWESILDAEVPIALVVTIGAMAAYHWTVWKADRQRAPVEVETALRDVTLVCGDGVETAHDLAERLHVRVHRMPRLDTAAAIRDIDALVEELTREESKNVLVVVDDHGDFELVPVGAMRD